MLKPTVIDAKKLKLTDISTKTKDGAFDVKALAQDEGQVSLFVSLIAAGQFFPPILVFVFNGKYIILDGRTRLEAYRRLSRATVEAQVVQFTTKADMISLAFAANMNGGKATPVPPTLDDFRKVVRSLLKEGLEIPAVTQRLIEAGVPTAFAGRIVKDAAHRKERTDILHAVEDVEAGRRTVDECVRYYNVSRSQIEHNLANRGYNLDSFVRDAQAKMRGIHKAYKRLMNEENSQDALKAIKALREELVLMGRWADSKETAAQ